MRRITVFANFLVLAVAAGAANAQTVTSPKTFFQQLPAMKQLPPYNDLLKVADQIPHLSAADVKDLLPVLFAAMKIDSEVGIDAAFALYNVALRNDSGDLLNPHIPEIANMLLGRSDPRFGASANIVFANLRPMGKDVVPLMAAYIMGPSGTPSAKVDSLGAMLHISPALTPQAEAAALHVLNLPLNDTARHHALIAVGPLGASDKVVARVVQDFANTTETVQIGAIQSLAFMGRNVVMAHASDLAKVTQNPSSTPTARRLAQDVLDDKDLRCITLQGAPMLPCK